MRIRLIREGGEVIESILDRDGLVSRAINELHNSRLIHYVDAYGDTYFNKLQMRDFLQDWQAAEHLNRSENDEICWKEVTRLAEECQRRTHLYLRFVGD